MATAMSEVVERVQSLSEYSLAKVNGTEWFENCRKRLGLQQTIQRSLYANYQSWLERFFPINGKRELTSEDVSCLKSAWLDIGHHKEKLIALMAIGSRDDRWLFPYSM